MSFFGLFDTRDDVDRLMDTFLDEWEREVLSARLTSGEVEVLAKRLEQEIRSYFSRADWTRIRLMGRPREYDDGDGGAWL